ncbi:glutamate synthase large subunit [Gemmata sp. JC673]|uniref:Glutamate synthase large subunit n=1 Tax=Gemmata algarum TaxID=2975278 RepID=A0ABU5F9Q7_9BACT|nr:glutamate synthase large subunit [Gemmata algarum]MDY3563492.1 glutamate synthase large subunit [Gemmata algarum]
MQPETLAFVPSPLVPEGLYHPSFERDACGVGFVADLRGRKTHATVSDALQLLRNLQHRGACGCDQDTGDGAGILLQLPDPFFRDAAAKLNVALPAAGSYGVAFCFLPADAANAAACRRALEKVVAEEGQTVLGWRPVPVVSAAIGWLARTTEPAMEQLLVGRGAGTPADAFERKLYVIRRRTEHWAATAPAGAGFAVTSCSARTIVYKGMLKPDQLEAYFPDLSQPGVESALALVHSRYSTNTSPQWSLAHPFNVLAHNGEINTLNGNVHWLKARQALMEGGALGDDLRKVLPLDLDGLSDSAVLDRAVELLLHSGRSLPHVMMMLVPEAYEEQKHLDPAVRGFFRYHRCLTEPWDGPASLSFTDGTIIGAMLDRNGLRPGRYVITDERVIVASEIGALPTPTGAVKTAGRMQPGKMFIVDTSCGSVILDDEIKLEVAREKPYAEWVAANQVQLDDLPAAAPVEPDLATVRNRQHAFGYTQEDVARVLLPMAQDGQEPVSSMGTDTPLAVLSDRAQLLFNYFKQHFAQVTNPPIDPIREKVVMNTESLIGCEQNILAETPEHARLLRLKGPTLNDEELAKVRALDRPGLKVCTLTTLFDRSAGEPGLARAVDALCGEAEAAVRAGATILILSDRGVDAQRVPVPSLLATAAVNHHLIRAGLRVKCGLVVETGEAREVHHLALLVGYGAAAVNPYLALETYRDLAAEGMLVDAHGGQLELAKAFKNYAKAINAGLLKVFSKMGISTLLSYRGAQIFEAIGLNRDLIDKHFVDTPSRIAGIGLGEIARESLTRHAVGFPDARAAEAGGGHEVSPPELDVGGEIMWRRRGEHRMWNPETVQTLQHAVRKESREAYREFAQAANDESRRLCTLRGLLGVKKTHKPIPLELVEPAKEIVKRFFTGAMSFGSISKEAHETLAIALNRVGGRSNTGEGGEDPVRFKPDTNGDRRGSAVKQVASGRFGVTANYLANAVEIQIKMAQGAKPGEGGQLPGHKVDSAIAKTRYSTPGVGLISPPPHHDIYSIEDLAQLIFDLKNANPHAEISVKLVAAAGVGTVAAGVAKGYADRILVSGDSGGTGASPLSSIRHAGVPWELGLAEAQQVLVRNGLRGRVRLQTDGQMKTGRDVVIAACLGAEEYGFATAPLIAMGCVMMRKCHLNTCPVGIATQDPVLRAQFTGTPEHVVNYLFFVAEEVRELLSEMGFRTLDEIVGRPDLLAPIDLSWHWKAKHLDLSALLARPNVPFGSVVRNVERQPDILAEQLDWEVVRAAKEAVEHPRRLQLAMPITNRNRTTGTLLSYFVTARYGEAGLREDTIDLRFTGTAGQSFGAFLTRGITLRLRGEANDYVGKGLSGGKLIVAPQPEAGYVPEENVVIGNVALYGATGGEAYFRGRAGERFAVRNSGAKAVVEGIGDHGCEYMTGGVVVVLGPTGRNFAAGMSGGFAYVYDPHGTFRENCNLEMVDLLPVEEYKDVGTLSNLINRHVLYTGSTVGNAIVDDFAAALPKFVKVYPKDYRRVLEQNKAVQRQWELVNG